MARDFLLNFATVAKTKASGAGATTTIGSSTTLGNADQALNITPWVLTRDAGLYLKVMINLTSTTGGTAGGNVQYQVRLFAAKAIAGTYTAVHQTPSDAVFLQSVQTAAATPGKTSFEVYLPMTVPCGTNNSTDDVYNWFKVEIQDTLNAGTGTAPTAAAATYTVHIVQGKDGSYS
jgi:hypothetical protein